MKEWEGGDTVLFRDREASLRRPDEYSLRWTVVDRRGDSRRVWHRFTRRAAIRKYRPLRRSVLKESEQWQPS